MTTKAQKKAQEFPNHIYVWVCDHCAGEPVFSATTDLADIDNHELVGRYARVEVNTMRVTKELV